MTAPINLGKARKTKVRADAQQRAAENRAKYGRTKAEKARDKLQATRAAKTLDDAKKHT